ncbi:MAG: asparagine synthase (glutamine-hydrolyzing) [Candidatus Calescibacterium sp.]|nr:asparagine synthase (glutamine-hydrolyzing) [Candidatus Calescibacterium sp.]MDW8088096.1 asparagine synthase (glutamine-hydrolyzing) [Candidatus Calescibacterium sp.]
MCEIAGVVSKKAIDEVRDSEIVRNMLKKLAHRGPDDEGIFIGKNFVFGHKRLSIIDIKYGKQPMVTEDGNLVITYNGEVYNYLELRQKLSLSGVDFRTFSDTEVLLKTIWKEGEDFLFKNAVGMFAFATFDFSKNRFLAAVDFFGIKPLYYFYDGDTLIFASEIKAILEYVKPQTNYQAIYDYITFQFSLGDKTFFKGIKRVPPAHYLVWNLHDDPKVVEYWDIHYNIDSYHTEEYFQDTLLILLQDSVRIHLRSDVPVGSHLSGGLDSSTVSVLAGRSYPSKFYLFHGRFPEYPDYDESKYANVIHGLLEDSELVEVKPSAEDFIQDMQKIVYFMDEPAAGPGVFPQFELNKVIKSYVKVSLGGQGGDEIFGGYTRYLIAYLEQCLKHAIFETNEEGKYVVTLSSIIENLPELKNYIPTLKYFWSDGLFDSMESRYFRLVDRSDELVQIMKDDFKEEYLREKEGRIFDEFIKIFDKKDAKSYFNKMTYFDMKTLLPALLHVEDRVSMAHSIESRVPILDRRIPEFMATVPPTIKFKNGTLKYLLKKSVENILPREIVGRKDKKGFPVPLNEWITENKKFREFVFDVAFSLPDIFDRTKVELLVNRARPFSRGVWGLINLSLWFSTFRL